MGYLENISYENFPNQSDKVGGRVSVCYHYDTSKLHDGVIVRDDREAPFETIIKLDNGRYVRGTECQYTFPKILTEDGNKSESDSQMMLLVQKKPASVSYYRVNTVEILDDEKEDE